MRTPALVVAVLIALATPAIAHAQRGRAPQGYFGANDTPAYRLGFSLGVRGGEDDGRRSRQFDFARRSDYRSADSGYRREYGDRDRYRVEFRLGFEVGYRNGYQRYSPANGRGGAWQPGPSGPPRWAVARGRGGYQRTDFAFRRGFTEGYEVGLRDARDRRRFDPTNEGRYRSGDRGYTRAYGSRDFYRLRYREAFLEGYQHGFDDGWRYDARDAGRPWWWPW
jgi:hypothetical protein